MRLHDPGFFMHCHTISSRRKPSPKSRSQNAWAKKRGQDFPAGVHGFGLRRLLFAGRKAHRKIQNRPNRRENRGRGRPSGKRAGRTNRSRARFTIATITTAAAKDLRKRRCTPDVFLLHSVKEIVRTSGRPDIRASKHPVNLSATQADRKPFPAFVTGAPEPLFSRDVTRPSPPARHPNPARNLRAAPFPPPDGR